MALTEAEKLKCKALLKVPANARYDYAGNDPGELLNGLSPEQETEVRAILTAWEPIRYDRDKLKAEGLDSDPVRTEGNLRRNLALVIGYRGRRGGIRLMRG